MMQKTKGILLNSLPVILMIALIPLVRNDYLLTGLYIAVIAVSFLIHREKHDLIALLFGFIVLTISEYFFVATGAEIFLRNSLFGVMPIWLPVLWGYSFTAIKRSIRILDLQ